MARIFISHSSKDNAQALAISQWLKANGWGVPYLDINPSQGLAPGEQWRKALAAAAARCEAVICLLSPAWLDSGECRGEFAFACYLQHKAIVGLVIDSPVDLRAVPAEMRSWQICDLTRGEKRLRIPVAHDSLVPPTEVEFAEAGLQQLARGLKASSLSPTEFQYDANRPPYCGLRPLEAEDAAIFFGREAAIVRGIEAIRRMREHGPHRLLVILGASGSGKSSFLRAGLWPRLQRDDQHFIPLPIIRAGRAALWGKTGLLACLETAFAALRQPKARTDLRDALAEDGGLTRLLTELQQQMAAGLPDEMARPTLVLSIDQAEELYGHDKRPDVTEPNAEVEEAQAFRRHLRHLLSSPNSEDGLMHPTGRGPLVLAAIRSDSYEKLQAEPNMADIGHIPFNLPPLTRGEYTQVITGPAEVATKNGHSLTIEPKLRERLLEDAEGADALPLLAFILEQLYLEGKSQGELGLQHYKALGGLKGSITAAITAALSEPERAPAIPVHANERDRLLRKAVIGHLVTIDEDTGLTKRRIAQWSELPSDAHALLQRLIDARLLLTDTRMFGGHGEEHTVPVVEIAHEALIRQWDQLGLWIEEDKGFLIWQRRLKRAIQFWEAEQRADGALLTEFQLIEAERRLNERPDALNENERGFIMASQARKQKVIRDRRIKRAKTVTALILTGVMVALWVDIVIKDKLHLKSQQEQVDTILTSARVLTHNQEDPGTGALLLAQLARKDGLVGLEKEPTAAVVAAQRLLTQPIPTAIFRPSVDATTSTKATNARFSKDHERVSVSYSNGTVTTWPSKGKEAQRTLGTPVNATTQSSFSPDGQWVATWVIDKDTKQFGVQLSSIDGTTQPRTLAGHTATITSVVFSPDSTRVVTTSNDRTTQLWTVAGPTGPITLGKHEDGVTCAAFSSDGRSLATGSHDGTAKLWRTVDGVLQQSFGRPQNRDEKIGHTRGVTSVAFSQDATGQFLVTTSTDKTARVWRTDDQGVVIILAGHGDSVTQASFSPIEHAMVVTASQDYTARLWRLDWTTRLATSQTLQGHSGAVTNAWFTHDGKRLLTASEDDTVRLWDPGRPGRAVVLRGDANAVTSAALTSDDRQVVTTSADGTARIWSLPGNDEPRILRMHQDKVTSVTYSPDLADAAKIPKYIFTGSDDGTVIRWLAQEPWTPSLLGRHPASGQNSNWVRTVDVSRDGTRLVTASQDRTARIWSVAIPDGTDSETGQLPRRVLPHKAPVTSAAFSPDGSKILTTTEACDVDQLPPICEGERGKRVPTVHLWSFTSDGITDLPTKHTGTVLKGAYSHDQSRIVTASRDGTARVWQVANLDTSVEIKHEKGSEVIDAAFAPNDASLVVTASTDGVARLWRIDGKTAHLLHATSRHDNFVTSAAFSPLGSFLVTTSDDWTARVWKIATQPGGDEKQVSLGSPVILRGHEDVVRRAAFSPDEKLLVTGSHDRTVRLWRIDWDELQQYFKTRTVGCLTVQQREEYLRESRSDARNAVARCEQDLFRGRPGSQQVAQR